MPLTQADARRRLDPAPTGFGEVSKLGAPFQGSRPYSVAWEEAMNGEELVNAARVDFGKTWPTKTEAALRRLGARLTEPRDDLPLERPMDCEHGVPL